eukprot:6188891-Pleurochrysis_carterae.AAC.1
MADPHCEDDAQERALGGETQRRGRRRGRLASRGRVESRWWERETKGLQRISSSKGTTAAAGGPRCGVPVGASDSCAQPPLLYDCY